MHIHISPRWLKLGGSRLTFVVVVVVVSSPFNGRLQLQKGPANANMYVVCVLCTFILSPCYFDINSCQFCTLSAYTYSRQRRINNKNRKICSHRNNFQSPWNVLFLFCCKGMRDVDSNWNAKIGVYAVIIRVYGRIEAESSKRRGRNYDDGGRTGVRTDNDDNVRCRVAGWQGGWFGFRVERENWRSHLGFTQHTQIMLP